MIDMGWDDPLDEVASDVARFSLDDRFRGWVASTPDRAAVVDPRRPTPLSFVELDGVVDQLRGGLAAAGLSRGDVIAVQLPNWWEFVALYLASLRSGLVLCPMSPAYRQSEMRHMLRTSGARLLVVPASYKSVDHIELAATVIPDAPVLLGCYAVGLEGTSRLGVCPFTDLLGAPYVAVAEQLDPNEAAFVLFTSGSEAAPKAVVHSHATANHSVATCTSLWGLGSDDVVLVAPPLSHGAGFNWCMRQALYVGATQVLIDEWHPARAAELIASERCTFTYAPTRFLQDLLGVAQSGSRVQMRTFASGGSPIPRHFVDLAREAMGCAVLATYGQTECFVATSTRLDDDPAKTASTDGCAIPGAEVRIVDSEGVDVPVGEEGICITRGPHVAAGYLGSDGRVRRFSDDGWLWTGDLCTMDDLGYIRVVGREKEIIIRNGLNLSPAEIESHVLKVGGVLQAAVVGYADELVGERACVVVTVDPDQSVTLDDIIEQMSRSGVAKYKYPEKLVVVDEIPHSAIGKIQRRELKRSLVEAGLLS